MWFIWSVGKKKKKRVEDVVASFGGGLVSYKCSNFYFWLITNFSLNGRCFWSYKIVFSNIYAWVITWYHGCKEKYLTAASLFTQPIFVFCSSHKFAWELHCLLARKTEAYTASWWDFLFFTIWFLVLIFQLILALSSLDFGK